MARSIIWTRCLKRSTFVVASVHGRFKMDRCSANRSLVRAVHNRYARLDLDWRWHESALRIGCFMGINPDAHSTRELDLTHWGVVLARKGGARIPERSATRLREADLDVLSKLGKQGLEWRLEPEAFTGREVGREDDLLDFPVGRPVDIEVARQPSA
jgi:hypothetical protein